MMVYICLLKIPKIVNIDLIEEKFEKENFPDQFNSDQLLNLDIKSIFA